MSKTIVIAEDFNSSRNIIKNTLEKLGMTVLEAADGREAMKFFDGRKIDLVVTDYNMPNMSGAELIEFIRNKKEYQFLPILVLTTETNQEKKNRVVNLNITGWIRKPFEMEDFKKVIQRALRLN